MWSLECWTHFTFLLASPLSWLIRTDIAHSRFFPVEFSIAIQIKPNHKWGNCTENRIFLLLRISSPLAGQIDPVGQSQHHPLMPHICLAERGRNPDFFPLNPHQLPKLHKRKYIKDASRYFGPWKNSQPTHPIPSQQGHPGLPLTPRAHIPTFCL